VDNATIAMNAVAASVKLAPGDEVLLTNHEYGAVKNIWQARCRAAKAKLTYATLPSPHLRQKRWRPWNPPSPRTLG